MMQLLLMAGSAAAAAVYNPLINNAGTITINFVAASAVINSYYCCATWSKPIYSILQKNPLFLGDTYGRNDWHRWTTSGRTDRDLKQPLNTCK